MTRLADRTRGQLRAGGVSFVLVIIVVASIACGGSSPTEPSFPTSNGGTSAVSEGAVISGEVQGGGDAFAESVQTAAADPANIQVSVQGTSISTTTDEDGRFTLINVPAGTIVLIFKRTDIDASVDVNGVGQSSHVQITVNVQSSSASIVSQNNDSLLEFEGNVTGVGADSLTLDDGTTVFTDERTAWDDDGDLTSLAQVEQALLDGASVEVEGRGIEDGGGILASVIEAELEETEFGGLVTAVDVGTGSIDLDTGVTVLVDAATIWDPEGDATTIEELSTLFDAGNTIEVDGEGALQGDGSILASEIEADVDEVEFEGLVDEVADVDTTAGTLLLDDGTVVAVDADTEWSTSGNSNGAGRGNIDSLEEILFHLEEGKIVEVEGEGILREDGSILATEIEAKPEDDDGSGRSDADFSDEIEELEDLIEATNEAADAAGLNGGQRNSLITKLTNAISSLERGNASAAVGQLGAYINQVEAFSRNGRLEPEDADDLIEKAEEIIEAINDKK